jgi:hypothetical protein
VILSDLANVYYDILVFFSPSGIESLFHNFPDFKQNDTRIAVFGNTTVKAVKEKGLRVDIAAPTPDTPSMTMALQKYIDESIKVNNTIHLIKKRFSLKNRFFFALSFRRHIVVDRLVLFLQRHTIQIS